jgi:hydrogenase-1 operon protein HyaF
MTSACLAQQAQNDAMVDALLREILVGLKHFAATGDSVSIDLGGLPMSGRDRAALDVFLDAGEVRATIETVGRSEVWETRFSGVWRVRHFGDDQIAVDLIEIAACPKILSADQRDAQGSARRLEEALDEKIAKTEISHET